MIIMQSTFRNSQFLMSPRHSKAAGLRCYVTACVCGFHSHERGSNFFCICSMLLMLTSRDLICTCSMGPSLSAITEIIFWGENLDFGTFCKSITVLATITNLGVCSILMAHIQIKLIQVRVGMSPVLCAPSTQLRHGSCM